MKRFLFIAVWLGLLVPISPAAQDAPQRNFQLTVVHGRQNERVSGAEVRWMSSGAYRDHLIRKERGATSEPSAVTATQGQTIALDSEGKAQWLVPAESFYLLARADGLRAWRVVPSQADPLTLRLQPESSLIVQVVDPNGVPITGVRVELRRPHPTRSDKDRWIAGQRTTPLGLAHFEQIGSRFPEVEWVTPETLAAQAVSIVVPVNGSENIRLPLSAEHWRSGRVQVITPELGYLAVQAHGPAQRTWLSQGINITHRTDAGFESNGTYYGPISGEVRELAGLGQTFKINANGGNCLSLLETVVAGPTRPNQTVSVGPLIPLDHVPIHLHFEEWPEVESAELGSLYIRLVGQTPIGPNRVRALRKDLGPESKLTLWVPEKHRHNDEISVHVQFSVRSQLIAQAMVSGGFAEGETYPVRLELSTNRSMHGLSTQGLSTQGLSTQGLSIPGLSTPRSGPREPQTILSGRVVDETGEPVPFASVGVLEDDAARTEEAWTTPDDLSPTRMVCNQRGEFEFRSQSESLRFRLEARASGRGMAQPIEVHRGQSGLQLKITLPPPGETWPIRPIARRVYRGRNTGSFEIQVLNSDGTPLARREVQARWVDLDGNPAEVSQSSWRDAHRGWWTQRTDLLGRFWIHRPSRSSAATPALYVLLERSSDALEIAHIDGSLNAAEANPATLAPLQPIASGWLRDDAGSPIADRQVALALPGTSPVWAILQSAPGPRLHSLFGPRKTRADGSFELYTAPGSPPLQIVMQPTPGLRLIETVEVGSAAKDLVLTAVRLGAVEFELHLPTGLHASQAIVSLVEATQGTATLVKPIGNGHPLALVDLPPGEYRLRFEFKNAELLPKSERLHSLPLLRESEPFRVVRAVDGARQTLPPIDLREVMRTIEVVGVLDGQTHALRGDQLFLRSPDGGAPPFSHVPYRHLIYGIDDPDSKNHGQLMVDSGRPVEISARGEIALTDSAGNMRMAAFVSDRVLCQPNQTKVELHLTAPEPLVLQLDPATLRAAEPFEWHYMFISPRYDPAPLPEPPNGQPTDLSVSSWVPASGKGWSYSGRYRGTQEASSRVPTGGRIVVPPALVAQLGNQHFDLVLALSPKLVGPIFDRRKWIESAYDSDRNWSVLRQVPFEFLIKRPADPKDLTLWTLRLPQASSTPISVRVPEPVVDAARMRLLGPVGH